MVALTQGIAVFSKLYCCSSLAQHALPQQEPQSATFCCIQKSALHLTQFAGLSQSSRLPRNKTSGQHCRHSWEARTSRACTSMSLIGEDPDYNDSDYIALGLAHCFSKDDSAKLQDEFVVEPIPAGALECMDNGGVTSYKIVSGSNLGIALKQDTSLLPPEFQGAKFCEDFAFRTKCASRTWKRDHAQEFLLGLVPLGEVRSDFNFNLEDKRVLNMEYEVDDSDNIKQDMSIDVYGRTDKEGEEENKEIEKLYNV